jgi:transcriptional antiterminator
MKIMINYTFTEEQLNALIYEIMELASAGVSFECWKAEDRDFDEQLESKDAWYFYPIEGDAFDIDDLDSIKQLTK